MLINPRHPSLHIGAIESPDIRVRSERSYANQRIIHKQKYKLFINPLPPGAVMSCVIAIS